MFCSHLFVPLQRKKHGSLLTPWCFVCYKETELMMRRRIYFFFTALVLGALSMTAENVIQVKPVVTKPGVTADDAGCLSFEMTNEEENIVAYEFMIKLPDGMEFEDSDPVNAPAFELTLDRYPHTGRNPVYQHSLNYAKKEAGWWKILVTSSQLNPINGTSGEILKGYFTTSTTMQPGIYPIIIKETILGISSTEEAETAAVAVSYVTVTEDGTAMQEADVDLSDFEGYMPSFVVSQLNADLQADKALRWLKVPETTVLGGELTVKDNVVYQIGTTGGLKRTFPGGQRSTVCLPFELNTDQVDAIKERGCKIESFAGYQASRESIWFDPVKMMVAHKPYLVTVTDNAAVDLFDGIDGVDIEQPVEAGSVMWGDMSFKGSYETLSLTSDNSTTYYAYDAADGTFVRVGSNAKVLPYRCYMALDGGKGARQLIITDGYQEDKPVVPVEPEDPEVEEPTGVDSVNMNDNGNGVVYDLQGRRVAQPAKGLYIKNGRKFIKK